MKTSMSVVLRFFALLIITGCSGEAIVGDDLDAAPQQSTACQMAAATLCEAACGCQESDECYTIYGGGGATVQYDNLAHCQAFEAWACGQSNASNSTIQTCIDKLEVATCEISPSGDMASGLSMPTECVDVNL